METLKLSLTTFLRISARKIPTKVRELKVFTAPGGYDFYKVLKRLAYGLASGKINFDDAMQAVSKIKQNAERNHTEEAITRFFDWLQTEPKFKWKEPPRGVFTSPSGHVKIRLAPELAYLDSKDKMVALQLWNLKQPELRPSLAAKGIRLFIDELPAKIRYGILDLRKQQTYTEAAITGASDVQLNRDIQIIEAIWEDLHDTSMSTEDVVEHVTAIGAI